MSKWKKTRWQLPIGCLYNNILFQKVEYREQAQKMMKKIDFSMLIYAVFENDVGNNN